VEDNHAIGMTLFVDDGSLLGSNTSGWEFMAGVPVLPGLGLALLALLLAGAGALRAGCKPPAGA
jgi:hypothetical protein